MEFREMVDSDWAVVADIYRQGIETGNATFDPNVPTWQSWSDSHLQKCRIVTTLNSEVVAWAALSAVSGRCVFAGVAEVSIYVSQHHFGKCIGTRLLEKLVGESEQNGIWTLQSGIFPENIGSIKIHEKNGFEKVGIRKKIGKMEDRWRDIVLMERRSQSFGFE